MKRTTGVLVVVGASIATIATVAGIILSSSTGSNTVSEEPENQADTRLSYAGLTNGGAPARGDPSAPITLIEFADFQCPNCSRFARNTAPQIVESYVETGKVNMVYKHFPIRGPDSITASLASQCAADQAKFWQFHDLLFSNQKAEGSGWASAENMKGFASDLGLDREEFDSCLDSQKYKALVEEDLSFGRQIGVSGTPTFVIVNSDGSEPEGILGAQPLTTFTTLLDKKIGQ